MFAFVEGKGKKGVLGARQGAEKTGQLILSMGLARAKVHIFVHKATTPSNSFFYTYLITTHALNIVYMFVYHGPKNIFSPLQVKYKPHDGDSEHAFVLGLLDCMVAINT
jgi:hypothetical protein